MPKTHDLNCARLRPHREGENAYPCSCKQLPSANSPEGRKHNVECKRITSAGKYDAEQVCTCPPEQVHQVHNHGPHKGQGPDGHCVEVTQDGKLYGLCVLPEMKPDTGPRTEPDWSRPPVSTSRPPAALPVDSEDLGATLTRWWVQKAQEEADALVPKAVEYGGAHRASDLTQLGRTIAELINPDYVSGHTEYTDGQLQELACYFYIQGKMGRWHAALLEGRDVSDDTLHDIKIYTTMVQRIRAAGGWPV